MKDFFFWKEQGHMECLDGRDLVWKCHENLEWSRWKDEVSVSDRSVNADDMR